jgi:hypothetical protein
MRSEQRGDKAVTIIIWGICAALLCMAVNFAGKLAGWW